MEPEKCQTVPEYSKHLTAEKVKVPPELVRKMIDEFPPYNPQFFEKFYLDWDPTQLEVNRMARILYEKTDRDKYLEMVRRVAAFRSLFLRKYQGHKIPHDATPEQAQKLFKRSCGWKTLAREAVTVRQEDIDMLTEEWFLLYEKYFLRQEQKQAEQDGSV
ncbi:MAG: hypothetical protein NC218_03725 [Acetobacter sp.]|nr:hypothetical protein [Acetobacter sp.]